MVCWIVSLLLFLSDIPWNPITDLATTLLSKEGQLHACALSCVLCISMCDPQILVFPEPSHLTSANPNMSTFRRIASSLTFCNFPAWCIVPTFHVAIFIFVLVLQAVTWWRSKAPCCVDNLLPGEVPFRTVPFTPLGLVFCIYDIHSRIGVVQTVRPPILFCWVCCRSLLSSRWFAVTMA